MALSRRDFIVSTCVLGAAACSRSLADTHEKSAAPLSEVGYGDVTLAEGPAETQFRETISVLMGLDEDSLLRPFRQMAGQPAPGKDLGGWYNYDPKYDFHHDDAGFAPSATFGQWVSALARAYAVDGDPRIREKVLRLNQLYGKTICGDFYENNRFPAYCYDKLLLGLIDSHRYLSDPAVFALLKRTTAAALPHLPPKAIEHDVNWRPGKDKSYSWDESYTIPENLFLAYQRGAGAQYRELAIRFLNDQTWFDPLSRGENVLAGRHAYSYVNSLSSAAQAYLSVGSEKHLRAAKNGLRMVQEQSFATGGWGPDETLRAPESDDLFASLSNTHNSFETPCGAYAHFKITRYLLRITGDSRYGDSMERTMYNTVMGAKPLQADGHAFYYSDYNFAGKKVFSTHLWPCCSGTLPQVATDYRINSYFRGGDDIYVNLYLPSTLRWSLNESKWSMTQRHSYPLDGELHFALTTPRPAEFAIRLRVPEWADGASVQVNGKPVPAEVVPGTFLSLRRRWRTGDNIDLKFPMNFRLEALNARHPEMVALMRGPLVLFPLQSGAVKVSRQQLLAAKRVGDLRWEFSNGSGAVELAPFFAIGEQPYSTYVQLT